jgi:hypothetical protein
MKKYLVAAALAAVAAVPAVAAAPAGATEPCVQVFQDVNCVKPSDVTRAVCIVGQRLGANCIESRD